MGYVNEGIDYLKKHYAHMLVEGELGTLWEYANLYAQNKGQRYTGARDKFEGRSWCTAQGENGFPGISLSRWVLGFQSETPGLKEVEINALFSPYKEFSGVLPTPQGVIKVERKDNKVSVDVPSGVTAYLSKDKLVSNNIKTITVDGEVKVIATLQGDIQMSEGKHSIVF
jgi:hypothetical protein